MKNEMNPLVNGERTALIIKVIDEDKAFSYIGKHMLDKIDTNECGFIIEQMYLSEDRYKEELKEDLVKDIQNEIEHHGSEMMKSILAKLK